MCCSLRVDCYAIVAVRCLLVLVCVAWCLIVICGLLFVLCWWLFADWCFLFVVC